MSAAETKIIPNSCAFEETACCAAVSAYGTLLRYATMSTDVQELVPSLPVDVLTLSVPSMY